VTTVGKRVSRNKERHYPWILWPFVALWNLLSFILELTGRVVAALLGLALMVAGVALTVTILGAPVGIPLIVLGFLLMVRSLF
jgi:hypothetical protein